MIQEIFNTKSYLKLASLIDLEAQIQEDGKVLDITEWLPEACPTSKSEQELREYIRHVTMTRSVKYAFVHCTATRPEATISAILNYWRKTLKWNNVGYHILIGLEGFTVLSDFNNVTNGVAGYNSSSVHFSYIGGIDEKGKPKDTRTHLQKKLISVCLSEIIKLIKDIKVLGHNEVSAKACPSFSVKNEYPLFWTGEN